MLNAFGTTQLSAQVAPGEIEELVLQLYVQGLLEISGSPPRFVSAVSAAPCASPLARQQSADGSVVTNLRHERVRLEPLERELVRFLDGSHTEPELVELLDKTLLTGAMTISSDAGPLPPEKRPPELISAILEHGLKSLAGQAILQS